MGCQTGFYLLVDGTMLDGASLLSLLREVFRQAAEYTGAMPGASEKECGNCKNLSLAAAKSVCGEYLNVLDHLTPENMSYPTSVQS